tara:strand:- start:593 stop:796 length:204 start_codon:yes stop_codon:yes gene_type:complete
MSNQYTSTLGSYIYTYSNGVFKASTVLDPDISIFEIETNKINSVKDFEKEIMWQQTSLADLQSDELY